MYISSPLPFIHSSILHETWGNKSKLSRQANVGGGLPLLSPLPWPRTLLPPNSRTSDSIKQTDARPGSFCARLVFRLLGTNPRCRFQEHGNGTQAAPLRASRQTLTEVWDGGTHLQKKKKEKNDAYWKNKLVKNSSRCLQLIKLVKCFNMFFHHGLFACILLCPSVPSVPYCITGGNVSCCRLRKMMLRASREPQTNRH